MACSILCVIQMIVTFDSRFIFEISCSISWEDVGSNADVISSNRSIFGLFTIERAIDTFCFWPPDKSSARRYKKVWSSPAASKNKIASFSVNFFYCNVKGSAMFSKTVPRIIGAFCKTMPISFRSLVGSIK